MRERATAVGSSTMLAPPFSHSIGRKGIFFSRPVLLTELLSLSVKGRAGPARPQGSTCRYDYKKGLFFLILCCFFFSIHVSYMNQGRKKGAAAGPGRHAVCCITTPRYFSEGSPPLSRTPWAPPLYIFFIVPTIKNHSGIWKKKGAIYIYIYPGRFSIICRYCRRLINCQSIL